MADATKVNRHVVIGPVVAAAHVAKVNRYIVVGPAAATTRGQSYIQVRYGEEPERIATGEGESGGGGAASPGSPPPPPPPPPPPMGGINFGEYTRQGFGGYPSAEVPGATIVSGTAAGYFITDDLGYWVPANSDAFTWEVAWTPPGSMGTDRTVTGTSSGGIDYTFNIMKYAAHARERTGRATNPDTAFPTSPKATCEAFNYFGRGSSQYRVPLGVDIYLRDGMVNPTGSLGGATGFLCTPAPAASYTNGGDGSGKIRIRSETVDATTNADGYPNREHGAGFGAINMKATGSGGTCPIEFVDLLFMPTAAPNVQTSIVGHNVSGNDIGAKWDNCGIMCPSSFSSPSWAGITSVASNTVITDCTFTRTHTCINTRSGASGVTITDNVAFDIEDGDFSQGAVNSHTFTITGNVVFRGAPGALGVHPDFFQHLGVTNGNSHPLGTIADNICYDWAGQFLFIAGTTVGTGNGFSAGTIRNNMGSVTNPYHLACLCVAGVQVKFNTFLADPSAPAGSALCQINGAADATVTRNISNRYTTSGQTGTVTLSPNPNVSIPTITAASYVAAGFTGYVDPALATDYTLAGLKGYFTPSNAAYNGSLALSGALDDSGNNSV